MNLCYSGMLKQLSLLTWSSTDFVGINWHNWGVLLVAVTAFLCELVFECLLISYSPPEATLKLELHRVQTPDHFPTNLTVTSGVIFSTGPGIYNCISFSLMSITMWSS